MKVLICAASTNGYRNQDGNAARLATVSHIVNLAKSLSIKIIVLPAGFWSVRSLKKAEELSKDVNGLCGTSIFLIAGIDILGLPPGNQIFYGFRTYPHGDFMELWGQVSTTNKDAENVPQKEIQRISERSFSVDGTKILPLSCGEIHNRRIRDLLSRERPSIVTISGHDSLGQGLVPTLRAVKNNVDGIVVHSQHLVPRSNGHIHWIDKDGIHHKHNVKGNRINFPEGGALWMSWAIAEC